MKAKLKLALAAIALLAAAMLVSCSKPNEGAAASSGPEPPNRLTIWAWDQNFNIYSMNKAAEIYAKAHPGFAIELTDITWGDIETRLITMASSGDLSGLPDIFLMQDNSIKKFASFYPELFADLTDSGIDFSEFAPSKTAYSVLDGRNYAVPFDSGAAIHCVRTDYLAQAGFTPEDFSDITWEEYIEKGKAVRDATGHPMITVPNFGDHILLMLYSAGAAMFRDDGSLFIEGNDVLRKCLEIYVDMVREGVLVETTDWDQHISSINNGTVAGVMNGCWIMASVQEQPSQSGNWAIVNMPRLSDVPGATNYSSNGGSSWIVTSGSKNPELAIDFLKSTFAGSTELYDDLITIGALATWIPAGDSTVYHQPVEFFGGQAAYAAIVDFSARIPVYPTSPFHYEARDAVGVALSNIVQRGADIDAELRDAQATAEFSIEG